MRITSTPEATRLRHGVGFYDTEVDLMAQLELAANAAIELHARVESLEKTLSYFRTDSQPN